MPLVPNRAYLNGKLINFLSNRLGQHATRSELAPKLEHLETAKMNDLTTEEEQKIIDLWRPLGDKTLNLDYWRFYKSFGIESPLLVPDNIYWSKILRTLNPLSLTRTYINKNLYPIIFKGLRQPEIIVNVINDIPYNKDMEILSYDKVYDLLTNYKDDIIIKPTTSTSGGKGVTLIKANLSKEEIKVILSKYKRNYICQKIVRQSASTAIFNASSLNTFRVNTLHLNGKITCENIMMRHGLDGSIVDNFAKGGVLCGMTPTGEFNGNNYNNNFERLAILPNGIKYDTLQIPRVKDIIDTAIDSHRRYMPHIGHAAWDFAIDENENPIMIEVNLMWPGIMGEQLSAGQSIFGDRTEEVIRHALAEFKSLSWTEFIGWSY